MAVRKASASAANASNDSALWVLAELVNQLATAVNALTAKIDADAGDTGGDNDYASTIGTMDTFAFRESGTPS